MYYRSYLLAKQIDNKTGMSDYEKAIIKEMELIFAHTQHAQYLNYNRLFGF